MTQSPSISSLLFLYAESPLHAGSGDALGAVDLPIQRERLSRLPMVQGSGLKGALRAEIGREAPSYDTALFGREPPSGRVDDAEDKAGAVSVLDARLLLFAMRTVWGGFAWVTSPLVLARLARDLDLIGVASDVPTFGKVGPGKCLVAADCAVAKSDKVLLEDFEYSANKSDEVSKLAAWLGAHALPERASYAPFRDRLPRQLVVIDDEELQFLASHATEVVTRIAIDKDTGTVDDGALWTEESIPAESVLWSVVFVQDERPARPGPGGVKREQLPPKVASKLYQQLEQLLQKTQRLRLGGDRSTGRGIIGVRLSRGSAS